MITTKTTAPKMPSMIKTVFRVDDIIKSSVFDGLYALAAEKVLKRQAQEQASGALPAPAYCLLLLTIQPPPITSSPR
jgi:hypothetical protein